MRLKEYLYTGLVVLSPILASYKSFLPGFSLAESLLLIFLLYYLFVCIRTEKIVLSKKSIPFIIFIFIIVILSILSILAVYRSKSDIIDMINRIGKRTFFILILIFLSAKWFDIKIAKSLIINVGKIGSVYLFIQYFSYYILGKILVGYISFVPLYYENYGTINYMEIYSNMFRPTSFFLEPAHFSRYMLIPLIILFFDKEYSILKKRYFWIIFFTGVIFFSTSGIGSILAFLVIMIKSGLKCLELLKMKKLKFKYILIIIIITAFFVYYINTTSGVATLSRIFSTDLNNINTAGGARFRGYFDYYNLSALEKIIGMGFGMVKEGGWYTGAAYILYGSGCIGFICVIYIFVNSFLKSSLLFQKIICLIFFVLFFLDDSFFGINFVIYFSFILYSDYMNKLRKEANTNEKNIVFNR